MRSRRFFRFLLSTALLAAGAFSASAQAPATASRQIHIRSIGPVITTVSDMDRSVEFYSRVLTFEKVTDAEVAGDELEHLFGVFGSRARIVRMRLGGESIELVQFLAPRGRPIPVDSRSNDLWFQHFAVIVSDMDRAYAVLRENNVEHASSGPQRLPDWNKNAGGIEAFYFKDPDGHPLEILHFPAGKGDPKWQAKTGQVFLGIDHTAIAVSDTDASVAFYGTLLGMRVAGESDNYGFEQEHLNNVFGAHLRITALRGRSGIGVEFLNYLTPRGGRPAAANASPTDIDHHETVIVVDDLAGLDAQLHAHNFSGVSVKQITDSGLQFNAGQADLVRDPDGHFLLLLQR